MIKILRQTKFVCTCGICETVLQYEEQDVKSERMGIQEWKHYITCPVCENEIEVKKK